MQPNGSGIRITDLAVSLIRTYVPVWVGAALAWAAAHWHIILSDDTSAQVAAWVVGAAIAAYYTLARWLERRKGTTRPAGFARWLGRWMLGGVLRQPVYPRPDELVRVLGADGSMRRPS